MLKGKEGIYYKNALNPQDPFFFKYKQTIIHFFIFGCAGSPLLRADFLTALASIVAEHKLMGFSNCGSWAQQLWPIGLVALQHVDSSQTSD